MWRRYKGKVVGVKVDGDPNIPPTRWWNGLLLSHFVWNKMVVVFSAQLNDDVESVLAGYRVGYITHNGKQRIQTAPINNNYFKMFLRHEPCTFFALDKDDNEIKLQIVAVTTRNDDRYIFHPLL